jgi:hypothetical protein
VRLKGRQLRFLMTAISGWTVVRVVATLPGAEVALLPSIPLDAAKAYAARALPAHETVPSVSVATNGLQARPFDPALQHPPTAAKTAPSAAFLPVDAPAPASAHARSAVPLAPAYAATPLIPAFGRPAQASSPSRWSAGAYLFVRPGDTQASLAGGGALGGSQAAARITYRINPDGPVRTALALRTYAPLHGPGAEAAAGFDWHPVAGRPLRLSVERRVALDGWGRNAWSAYAAGGVYAEPLPKVVVDGYAQAGIVGMRARDLFVDGGLRAGRRIALGDTMLVAGGGVWGAAQPRAERLDAGPRLALSVPVADVSLTVAAEGRFRLAGAARPGSGAALTVAVDF